MNHKQVLKREILRACQVVQKKNLTEAMNILFTCRDQLSRVSWELVSQIKSKLKCRQE